MSPNPYPHTPPEEWRRITREVAEELVADERLRSQHSIDANRTSEWIKVPVDYSAIRDAVYEGDDDA